MYHGYLNTYNLQNTVGNFATVAISSFHGDIFPSFINSKKDRQYIGQKGKQTKRQTKV
jgi:hypothetical protein